MIDFYDIGGGTQNILALDGAAAGATSENLPVLVGPNSTTTTLQFNQPNPNTLTHDTVDPGDTGIACFVSGSQILTPGGPRRIDHLSVGDLVETRDHGPQPIRWIGQREVCGLGEWAPVRIAPGTLGAHRTHSVSPNHRILLTGWRAELLFGEVEVLVPAKALINETTIRVVPMARVTYVHLLFDDHQVIEADGVTSESFYPGAQAVGDMCAATRAEILSLFPELAHQEGGYGPTARLVCPPALAPVLLAA